MVDDRLWHRSLSDGRLSQTHDNRLATGGGFRLNPLLNTSREKQQPSLSPRVLNRCTHERIDQFLQDNLAGHCLRDFDNGSQIQVFDRGPNGARRTGYGLFLPELRIQLVEMPDLTDGSPADIAVSGITQVRMRDLLKSACRVKTGRELVG